MKTYSPEAFFTPSTIHSTNRLSMRQGAHVTGSLGKYTKFAQQSPHPHPGLSSSACNEHFWVHLFLPRLPCRSLVGNYYSCCNLIKLANFFDCTYSGLTGRWIEGRIMYVLFTVLGYCIQLRAFLHLIVATFAKSRDQMDLPSYFTGLLKQG